MNIQKPRTAAPGISKRRHRRAGSQPIFEKMNFKHNFLTGQTTPIEFHTSTLPTTRETKRESSNFISNGIFNIEGFSGKIAIMATTSPSLISNFKSSRRFKKTLSLK